MSDEKNTTPAAIDESMKALQDENTSLKNRVKELEADKSKAQKSLDDSLKAVGELSEQLELREKNDDGASMVTMGNKSRSEERRGGKEGVSTGRSRWSHDHEKKKITKT